MKKDMRIVLTKRMLKEGLLQMLADKPLSKISITDLCEVSGVNRATFYNHYDSPVRILEEITYDYFDHLKNIYNTSLQKSGDPETSVEACLSYLMDKKSEIKLLFSKNAENAISGFALELVNGFVAENESLHRLVGNKTDQYLYAILTSSALFGLIQIWIVHDIEKTPKDIVALLKNVFRNPFYL